MSNDEQNAAAPVLGCDRLVRRGDVKRFRAFLNAQDNGIPHRHRRFHQRTRKYGDYLYAQDREKFMVDLREWLSSPNTKLRGAQPPEAQGGAFAS